MSALTACSGPITIWVSSSSPTAQPSSIATPAWLHLRRGLEVYTGYDGGDSNSTIVCATRLALQQQAAGKVVAGCSRRASGIAVHVVSVALDASRDFSTSQSDVTIASDDGAWRGVTGSARGLEPRIPAGTILLTDDSDHESVRISRSKDDLSDASFPLEKSTRIEVLQQDPRDPMDCTLFVRVRSGKFTGRKGWTVNGMLTTDAGRFLWLQP